MKQQKVTLMHHQLQGAESHQWREWRHWELPSFGLCSDHILMMAASKQFP